MSAVDWGAGLPHLADGFVVRRRDVSLSRGPMEKSMIGSKSIPLDFADLSNPQMEQQAMDA